jgi:hypothetical protein
MNYEYGTDFLEVYDIFLDEVTDDLITNAIRLDAEAEAGSEPNELQHAVMAPYLRRGVDFINEYTINYELDYNWKAKHFTIHLNRFQAVTVAMAMRLSWINQQITQSKKMEQVIRNKDFQESEGWRIIRTLEPIRQQLRTEIKQRIKNRSWNERIRDGLL